MDCFSPTMFCTRVLDVPIKINDESEKEKTCGKCGHYDQGADGCGPSFGYCEIHDMDVLGLHQTCDRFEMPNTLKEDTCQET